MTNAHHLPNNENWLQDAHIAVLRQIRSDHEERWLVSSRICRNLVREATISRFLLAALLVIQLGDFVAASRPVQFLVGAE